MAKTILHTEGESSAHALIRAGHYDMTSAWSFSAEDGNALLGPDGNDWAKFGRWHLGEDASEPADTKAHWKYPYGKDGKVYRRALGAIRSRASQNSDNTVFDAAGRLMTAMDEEEDKQESTMNLRQILGSRFGHFAMSPSARTAAEDDDDGEEAKRSNPEDVEEEAKRKEKEEARRKAEKEEEDEKERGRRARRARNARRAKKEDDDEDDDGDDAADDKKDDDDEDEEKKAAAAGYAFALDAAFREGARAQRRRCAAIFEHQAAAANPVMAMSLAFETTMTASAAIAVLEKTPASASARAISLHNRMTNSGAGAVRIPTGAPDGPRGQAAIAASWDYAFKKVAR